jgi:hypothetical protein
MSLPPDATLAEVWSLLANARAYAEGVYRQMALCQAAHGDARVRIAVSGTGQKPCYRVFYPAAVGGRDIVHGSYWDNHRPLDDAFARNEAWSTAAMTLAAVKALLDDKLIARPGAGAAKS